MGAEELGRGMICSCGKVDSNGLRTGRMSEEDWSRFRIGVGKV